MFFYYLPKNVKTEALPVEPTTRREVITGPDGGAGYVVADHDKHVGYYPKKQQWRQGQNKNYWLGFDGPVDPKDLQKKELIDGHYITLNDGNQWLIPVARSFPTGTRLPQVLLLGPNGELISESLPAYASFSQEMERVWDVFTDPDNNEALSMEEAWKIAVNALSINYHIQGEEVSFLKILTTNNVTDILKAVVDIPTLLEKSKKKAEDDDSLNAGEQD